MYSRNAIISFAVSLKILIVEPRNVIRGDCCRLRKIKSQQVESPQIQQIGFND